MHGDQVIFTVDSLCFFLIYIYIYFLKDNWFVFRKHQCQPRTVGGSNLLSINDFSLLLDSASAPGRLANESPQHGPHLSSRPVWEVGWMLHQTVRSFCAELAHRWACLLVSGGKKISWSQMAVHRWVWSLRKRITLQ